MKGRDIVVTHKKLPNMTKLTWFFSNQDNLAHCTQIISFLNFSPFPHIYIYIYIYICLHAGTTVISPWDSGLWVRNLSGALRNDFPTMAAYHCLLGMQSNAPRH